MIKVRRTGLPSRFLRRLILLVEDHYVEHTATPATAEEQLLADFEPVRVGRLA